MSVLELLPKQPTKTAPDVWVKRIVIVGQLQPEPEIIRDIRLRRGLNIIWAAEPEATDSKAAIAGHSAGKTTFCRLLRYVLGEKTYANRTGTQAIRESFPNGYVCAELMIENRQWAVLRPLGENRNSWILRDGTVEQVLREKGEPAYQDSYPVQIGLARRVDGLRSATVVRTQEEIKWAHVLAWCTRDQEARFQNVHEWRSPRSESEWPAFRFPKADPLFVMRIVLGLYLPDELGIEEDMAKNVRRLELAESQFESFKREPEFWSQHYDTRLREKLRERLPADADAIKAAQLRSSELLPDLERFTARVSFEIQEEIFQINERATELQIQVNTVNETIAASRLDIRDLQQMFNLEEKAVGEVQAGLNDAKRAGAHSEDHRLCPYGDVLLGECSYVRERRRRLAPGELQSAHNLEQMEAERLDAQQKLSHQMQEIQHKLAQSEFQRTGLIKRQDELAEQAHKLHVLRDQLGSDLRQLVTWRARLDAPETNTKTHEAAQTISDLKEKLDGERQKLNQLLANHDSNRELLNLIFSHAARLVLPGSAYNGRVNFENRELSFQVTHGGAMSGEAMETLAVLLSDISCLIFNLLSTEAHLPGFLLHDSPREADLGLRLYHSFISFIAQLESELTNAEGCPFQYILTTTTPPPPELRTKKFVVLQLDASRESDLLFRRDLSRPPTLEELPLV